ncbi:pyrroloquinoline quinone biosynthesis peptide chaperone PqqD [Roseomonas rosulenta]|uniref:pyrroloquinoline quinone biosynthesis peptide chaperone PqqD n=1 Tax=Roseomonas rosulenta TaxID=2748667 RepID=UPI0018DFBC6B|nr:pyrroloquinoline quinone biosynthesis peptide chaperone PqqD [Roseomonas rosulenta]
MDAATVPRLNRGVKLREDAVRGRWIVLAPERMFVPDEIALEVLRLVDGARSVGAIADELAARFAAPRDEILADVSEMLADLAAKGVVAT